MKNHQQSPLKAKSKQEQIAFIAAISSGIEIIVGSVLHGFKLPFGGHFLSLVQISFLSYSVGLAKSKMEAIKFPIYISSISSCLKSLSPAGNKLGPMLSIWTQGFLFSLGPLLFSRSKLGLAIGAALASLWAFFQPILTLYLFFGNSLFNVGDFYLKKMNKHFDISSDQIMFFVGSLICIKVLLAIVLASIIVPMFSRKILLWSEELYFRQRKLIYKSISKRQSESSQSTMMLALKDLCQPFFIISFLLGIIFFVYSVGDMAQVIWLSLRPIAVAYLFFVLSRSKLLASSVQRLRRFRMFDFFFGTFDLTIDFLTKDSKIELENKVSDG